MQTDAGSTAPAHLPLGAGARLHDCPDCRHSLTAEERIAALEQRIAELEGNNERLQQTIAFHDLHVCPSVYAPCTRLHADGGWWTYPYTITYSLGGNQ